MRLITIFLLVPCMLFADISMVIDGEPSTNIQNCVNAASGDFFIQETDLVVNGVEPLVFERFYSSASAGREGGWPISLGPRTT